MSDKKNVPVSVDPNMYSITNLTVMPTEEMFTLQVHTGNQVRLFQVTPKHAKRMMMLLQAHLDGYEKQFGQLETSLPEAPTAAQQETQRKAPGFVQSGAN